MSEYIIEFSKTGTICYTSHLDLMRIMRRAFKRTGIALAYSQGFNPHPKMGFAQPLSLGYWGMEEYLEFETADPWEPDQLLQRLAGAMPEGIELKRCLFAENLTKTLASHTVAAQYIIAIPVTKYAMDEVKTSGDADAPADTAEFHEAGDADVPADPAVDLSSAVSMWHSFMDPEEIHVWKRQKKKKEPKLIDIKEMIREITFTWTPSLPDDDAASIATGKELRGTLYLDALLDCGSNSNLSPELIITSVCSRFGIRTDRSEVSVMRKKIFFDKPLEKLLA